MAMGLALSRLGPGLSVTAIRRCRWGRAIDLVRCGNLHSTSVPLLTSPRSLVPSERMASNQRKCRPSASRYLTRYGAFYAFAVWQVYETMPSRGLP